jgi:pseudomonalisin
MHSHSSGRTRLLLRALLFVIVSGMLSSNALAQRSINDADRVILHGNTHPLARAEFDRGSANAAMAMNRMVLLLSVRPDAQATLQQLLADQQNLRSPSYHQWLTPQEFGLRFGPTDQDIADASNWLKKFGFKIDEVGNGRMWINFSGDVQKVERAFQTNIRNFEVNGKMHFANATDPSIPRALTGLVQGVVSLHNFPKHPNSTVNQLPSDFTAGNGAHFLAPADFATIYNVKPLYNAAPAIDGTGQTIAIVGRTDINLADVQFFRSFFGLPANDPIFVHNGADPGNLGGGEETEADLDVEWSGAIAKNATVKFVISQTAASDGVDLSAQFIVNNNLANIMSTSFGLCEQSLGAAGNNFWSTLWAQAAAQGITAFVSSGDSGAAGCDPSGAVSGTGLGVNGLSSTPNNVSVGGTEFNEGAGNFWSPTNNAVDQSSVLSYIPEIAWNESGAVAGGSNLFATGGGASIIYAKPAFQAGPGVPADGVRDIPDVSLTSAGHDGYIIVQGHTANASGLAAVGGTSAASPSFASLMALVVQKVGAAQGNANTVFYSMGQSQFVGGPAVYNDTTSGNNSVPGVVGFSAGGGYDEATGWGSVDASTLVNSWPSPAPNFTLAASPASQSANQGITANYTVTLTALNGFANSVTFSISSLPTGATATFTPASLTGSGTSALAISTTASTPIGNYPLTITGTDGVLTHTASLTLVVTAPDFSLTATPAQQTIVAGNTANYTATVGALNGYTGTVSLSVSGLPAGASAVFTPASITNSGSSALAIATTLGTTPIGSYPLVITATDGVLSHTASVTLTVSSDFTLSATPASQTVTAGINAGYQINMGSVSGFNGLVNLSVSVSPVVSGGPVASVNPTSLTGSGLAALSVTTANTTPAGTYTLTITGTSGSLVHSTSVTLVVTALGTGDFSITSPNTFTVKRGKSGSLPVTITGQAGFSGTVNLSLTGLPSLVTGSLSPTSVTGSGTSNLTLTVNNQQRQGAFQLTITGTSGTATHSTIVNFTVN